MVRQADKQTNQKLSFGDFLAIFNIQLSLSVCYAPTKGYAIFATYHISMMVFNGSILGGAWNPAKHYYCCLILTCDAINVNTINVFTMSSHVLMQKSDCDQLLQAIWSWDVATVETLINTRYIDVNTVNEVSGYCRYILWSGSRVFYSCKVYTYPTT